MQSSTKIYCDEGLLVWSPHPLDGHDDVAKHVLHPCPGAGFNRVESWPQATGCFCVPAVHKRLKPGSGKEFLKLFSSKSGACKEEIVRVEWVMDRREHLTGTDSCGYNFIIADKSVLNINADADLKAT